MNDLLMAGNIDENKNKIKCLYKKSTKKQILKS